MSSIDELLSRLNPAIAKQFELGSKVENRLLETPSLNINRAIGGFGYGRQSMIWGNKGTGKTAFCLQTAALAQAKGESVGWIDAEKNWDDKWAGRLGVDPDKMIVSKITSIKDMADASYDLIKSGVDVLFIDSISALIPQSYFTDKGEMKSLENTGQIGTFSKNMGTACNMLNNANKSTALIMISQVRNQILQAGAVPAPMGGKAVEHMNSTVLKLWCTPSDLGSITGERSVGNTIVSKPIGHPVTWTIDKNRGPGTKDSGKYDFYFGGDRLGVDLVGEIVDAAVEFGYIKKGGAWYEVDSAKLQGKASVVRHILSLPDLQAKLYGDILAESV